ncbi:hypothetical protein L7F22_009383 [Adiantum nelumboides]|nr:hypothetical protein [Adiantum nelumboides]
MVLDSNLFTLTFERRSKNANILDLIPFSSSSSLQDVASGSSGTTSSPLYTFSRARSNHYTVRLIDSLTDIVLASIDCPASTDKVKTIHLYNPNEEIILEKKGMTFRQDWRWNWQGNEFSIRKEGRQLIVEAIRKPDPEIDIARYTPRTKTRSATLQILDYNVQRLEVEDRRGLEIVTICAACHLLDQEYDEKHKEGGNMYFDGAMPVSTSSNLSIPPSSTLSSSNSVNQIAAEPNEIFLDLHVPNSSYVEHALDLLRQDKNGQGLHMIIIKADSQELTARAVRIAAEIKARWYKLPAIVKGRTLDPMPGNSSETAEELYQYVRDPTLEQENAKSNSNTDSSLLDPTAGPRGRIKLGSPMQNSASSSTKSPSPQPSNKRTSSFVSPPTKLDIYLSKDRIDEFERSKSSTQPSPRPISPPFLHHQVYRLKCQPVIVIINIRLVMEELSVY